MTVLPICSLAFTFGLHLSRAIFGKISRVLISPEV